MCNNDSIKFKSTYMPWIVWSLGCLFYFYECLLQVSPGVMSHELMRDFSVTSQTLGILSGIYFYSYAAMQIPGGVMMDRFGPHKLLTVATLICAFSTIAFGMTDHFWTACIARLMIGFGSAFAVVGSLKLAASWFAPQQFALLTGLTVTIGMLGAIGGEAPLAVLIDTCGWRYSLMIMGCIGLFLALLIVLIVRDDPKQGLIETDTVSQEHRKFFVNIFLLIKNKQLWLVAVYGGLMYMSTPVFCGLWGVPYLMLKMHVAKPVAANYISLVFVGWAIASPLWALFSNRIGRRKPPMYIAAIGSLITSLCFIYVSIQSQWIMQLLLLSFGIFSAGFLPAFTVAKELCSRRYVATSLSFMNMINMLGIAIAQPLIGFILDRFWTGAIIDNVRIYSLSAYHISLAILPCGILLALLILLFVHETYCQSIDN